MLYRFLRWLSGIALRWFYRDLEISGAARIPRSGPMLLAVNHPNALVDALVAGQLTDRRLLLTAKATLFEHPLLRVLFRLVGIVPLRRMSDEARRDAAALDATRNEDAFRAVITALAAGGAVLIFPEGRSHSEPALAPLRSGLARIALQARASGVRGISIVPVGLTFERKWRPRTRIVARVADPIPLDAWYDESRTDAVPALTRAVQERLRDATLNFASAEDAAWIIREARLLAGIFDRPRPLGAPDTPYSDEVDVVQRVQRASAELAGEGERRARAERFLERLAALRSELDARGIPANDIGISTRLAPGLRFAVRESAILLVSGPIATWGRVNHWLPLRIARAVAVRHSRSPEDPAMYTLVVGLALVVVAYVIQTALVAYVAGAVWAVIYLASLPLAATWDWRFRDRLRRARARMRTYRQFRREPGLQPRLQGETRWLREEALALEQSAEPRPGGDTRGEQTSPMVPR